MRQRVTTVIGRAIKNESEFGKKEEEKRVWEGLSLKLRKPRIDVTHAS